jgi:hypothetical protein
MPIGHKTDCQCSFCPNRKPISDETRKRLSEASKRHREGCVCSVCYRRPITDETRRRLSEARRGRVFSESTRRKISLALTGKKLSVEHRKNIGACQKGRVHSEETKRKMSEAHKGRPKPWARLRVGELHPNYIKDRALLKKSEKKHLDGRYREWMRGVKNRDGWQCRIANDDCSGRLEAHHILAWRSHPELRYQINNGITLCHAHHPRGEAEEKRLEPRFVELVSVSSE